MKEQKGMYKRKRHIQNEICEHILLIVNIIKGETSSLNGRNTARKFVGRYEKVSEITGTGATSTENLCIILKVLAYGKAIHTKRFYKHYTETTELLVDKYSWYCMPVFITPVSRLPFI